MGDMTGSADEEGGDQKAVQLATAASSVLNAKAGKSSGNDSSAASERAAVSKKIYSNNKNKTNLFVLTTWLFFTICVEKRSWKKVPATWSNRKCLQNQPGSQNCEPLHLRQP